MKGKKTQAEKDWVSEEDEDEKLDLKTEERFTSMKLKKIPTVKPKHIDKIMFEIEIAEMVKNIEEKFVTKVQFEELEEDIGREFTMKCDFDELSQEVVHIKEWISNFNQQLQDSNAKIK